MLKTLFLYTCVLISFNTFSQYNSEGADLISRFRPGFMWFFTGYRPAEPEKVRKYDRLMFDVTYNTWNGDLKPFENKWNSIGFNTSLMFDIPITKGNTVSFGTGLCHSLFRVNSSYHLFTTDSTNSYTEHFDITTLVAEKRFLGGNSFSVPLEFRFRTKGWKHFKVHIGGKIGYQLGMYSKVVVNGKNGDLIQKDRDFADVNRLTYSAHMRIGMRNWALFGSYNFNSLFSHEKSVQLNLLQVGLTISLF